MDGEHHNRDLVFTGEGNSGSVHHLQVTHQHFVVGECIKMFGFFVALRISGIYAVHLRALHQQVAAHFVGAECCCGIGGEEGVAGSGSENNNAATFHVAFGAAADIGFANLHHADGRKHACVHAHAL